MVHQGYRGDEALAGARYTLPSGRNLSFQIKLLGFPTVLVMCSVIDCGTAGSAFQAIRVDNGLGVGPCSPFTGPCGPYNDAACLWTGRTSGMLLILHIATGCSLLFNAEAAKSKLAN